MDQQSEVHSGRFWGGALICALGLYVFLNAAGLGQIVYWNEPVLTAYGLSLTGGMVLGAMVLGLVVVRIDPQAVYAWLILVGAILPIVIRVVQSMQQRLFSLSPTELVVSIMLIAFGLGLLLSSLRSPPANRAQRL